MAGIEVNIKVCSSHQLYLGLIESSSEIRHYAYTHGWQQGFEKNRLNRLVSIRELLSLPSNYYLKSHGD